jgi:hypothetical protein
MTVVVISDDGGRIEQLRLYVSAGFPFFPYVCLVPVALAGVRIEICLP